MKKVILVTRVLLGLMFFIFGLNGFLNFIPQPPIEGNIKLFTEALMFSKLIFAVKGFEVIIGLMLLSNVYVALALLLLTPITFNIFWFHANLSPEGLPMTLIIVLMQGFLMFVYRDKYKALWDVR